MVATDFDARAALQAVLDNEPTLCACGLGEGLNIAVDFAANRKSLLNNHQKGFQAAIRWLNRQERQTRVNRKFHSYGLKHVAEDMERTYICNGALIAAAIHLGIPFKATASGLNVHFAIRPKPGFFYRREDYWR